MAGKCVACGKKSTDLQAPSYHDGEGNLMCPECREEREYAFYH